MAKQIATLQIELFDHKEAFLDSKSIMFNDKEMDKKDKSTL